MRVIAPAPREIWRSVVCADPTSLPEHIPEWVDAISDVGPYEDASRLYEFRDGRRFVLPLVRWRGPRLAGAWLSSYPAGWGIGGLIGAGLDVSVVRSVLDDLCALRATRIGVRPDPISAGVWADAACGREDVTQVGRRAHVLDLSGGRDAAAAKLSRSARRGVRIAGRRGVTVEVDKSGRLLPLYYEMFRTSVDRWAARQHEPLPLAHWRARRRDPLDKLYAMSDRLSGRFRLSIAFVEGVPAAGTIVLLGRTAHYTRGAMNRDLSSPARANDLLQWMNIEAACAAGCAAYHMGESGTSESLASFKEGFGAVSIPYSEYRIERLPLTRSDAILRSGVKRLLRYQDA